MNVDSIRIDPGSGIEDHVQLAGPRERRIFVAVHLPRKRSSRTLLVVCPPILSDLAVHYRREVLLGRGLAAAGVAVARFQYRGTGHSQGDSAETTFETLVEDALLAAETALGIAPSDRLAFLGTRVGALVAAAAARCRGRAPVALWEPVTDGTSYWREAFRARLIRTMTESADGRRRAPDAVSELAAAGWVDVLGYRVDRRLYESLRVRTLAAELGPDPGPVLEFEPCGRRRGWWFTPGPTFEEVGPVARRIEAWLTSVGAP